MSKKKIIIHLDNKENENRESYKEACRVLEEYGRRYPSIADRKLCDLMYVYGPEEEYPVKGEPAFDFTDLKIIMEIIDKFRADYPKTSATEIIEGSICVVVDSYWTLRNKISDARDAAQYDPDHDKKVVLAGLIAACLGLSCCAYLTNSKKQEELPQPETTCTETVVEETISSESCIQNVSKTKTLVLKK